MHHSPLPAHLHIVTIDGGYWLSLKKDRINVCKTHFYNKIFTDFALLMPLTVVSVEPAGQALLGHFSSLSIDGPPG
jgi:hypothetical protein